ncbi:MAG: DUF2058 family protein [Planctomycetota bacterium]
MNLRDQLKKAKLLSEKDAKRLAHEERVHRKEVGREGIDAEKAQREAELTRLRADERTVDVERGKQLEAERLLAAERAACEAILETAVRSSGRGGAPWFFELPDGRLPQLRVDDADRHQLSTGQLCVVRRSRVDAHVYGFLAASHAQRVARALPDRVVWAAPGVLDKR